MTSIVFVCASSLFVASFLVGCPQGVESEPRQDGGEDADTFDVATLLDASPGEASTSDREPPVSSGALCGVGGQNQCGPFQICDPALGCVECTTGVDCPAAAGLCLVGRCVACRPGVATADGGVSDCPGADRACWTSDFECHARCTGPGTCPLDTRCDEVSGECIGCNTNAECATGVCNPQTKQCVECLTSATCSGQRPRCRVFTGACVACIADKDCGVAAPICDTATFTCRVGCSSDAHCPNQVCDLGTARCVDPPPPDAGAADAASTD